MQKKAKIFEEKILDKESLQALSWLNYVDVASSVI